MIETKFTELPWHDAELLDITINRRNPGYNDQVIINVCWPNGHKKALVFDDCFELEAKMNFGIIAQENIFDASSIDESQKLTEIRKKWAQLGVKLKKLKCFEIRTNSTNSIIRIYALSCSL